MTKKILLLIVLFLIMGLFANGVKNFFFSPRYVKNPEINNDSPKTKKNEVSILPKTQETASMFEGFKNFITNPTGATQEEHEEVQPNNYRDSIQKYFNKTAEIIFPTNESLQESISHYLADNDPEPLRNVIKDFRKANAELYNIDTPPEVQNIQNNSIWITNKIIETLDNIINAESKEKIIEITNGNSINEIKDKTLETRAEIQSLKTQYNLDIIL